MSFLDSQLDVIRKVWEMLLEVKERHLEYWWWSISRGMLAHKDFVIQGNCLR